MMPFNILAVEDRQSTAIRLETAIREAIAEVDVRIAVSTEGAKRLLPEISFDIIIVGGFLPEEDGGRTESGAGIRFLGFLNEINTRSHIIFYAGKEYNVRLATTMTVSERPVLAYIKAWLPRKRHPSLRFANPKEIAERCKSLLIQRRCSDQ